MDCKILEFGEISQRSKRYCKVVIFMFTLLYGANMKILCQSYQKKEKFHRNDCRKFIAIKGFQII